MGTKCMVLVCVVAALLGFLVPLVHKYRWALTPVPLTYAPTDGCVRLTAEGLVGAEDFAEYKGVLITGTDDRISLWELGTPAGTPSGGLFVVDPVGDGVRRLNLGGFPWDTLAFHPHGLFLHEHQGAHFLYVVNHAYAKGGERIEVFAVSGEGFEDLEVTHHQSLLSPAFEGLTGNLNDLLVTSDGHLLVTQYRAFPDFQDGRGHHSKNWLGSVHAALNKVDILLGSKDCYIWSCQFSPEKRGDTHANCVRASEAAVQPNGIHMAADGKIYVTSPPTRKIMVYTLDHRKLTLERYIDLPFPVDNLISLPDGSMMGGALVVHTFIKFVGTMEKLQQIPKNLFIDGGYVLLLPKEGNYTPHTSFILPGSLISGVSVATKINNKLFFGSWHDEGLLRCPQ
uniref:Uncharacterized protein n=1 Tax=Arcella intermedia TaxID=1963864 RepID=A0A6B2L681_9EUKA